MIKFKNVWSVAKKILSSTAVVYTVLYFIFLCFSRLVGVIDPAIHLRNSAILLFFAFLLTLCDLIFTVPGIHFILKLLIHFVCVLLSTIIATTLAGYDFSYKATLMFFVFMIIYIIFCIPYVLIGKKYKKGKKEPSKPSFESIFGHK